MADPQKEDQPLIFGQPVKPLKPVGQIPQTPVAPTNTNVQGSTLVGPKLPQVPTKSPTLPDNPYTMAVDLTKDMQALKDNNTNYAKDLTTAAEVIDTASQRLLALKKMRLGSISKTYGINALVGKGLDPLAAARQGKFDKSDTTVGQVTNEEILLSNAVAVAKDEITRITLERERNSALFSMSQYLIANSNANLEDTIKNLPQDMQGNQAMTSYLASIHDRAKRMFAARDAGYVSQTGPKQTKNIPTDTKNEVLKASISSPKTYEAPKSGIAISEVASLLETTPDELFILDTEHLIRSINDQHESTAKMIDMLRSFEGAPPASFQSLLLEATMQPTLLVGDMVNVFSDKWSKPFTGQVQAASALVAPHVQAGTLPESAAVVSGISRALLGPVGGHFVSSVLDPEMAEIGKGFQEQLDNHESWWDISRSVYDLDSEAMWGPKQAQWFTKLANEVLLDPTTYLGMWKVAPAIMNKIPRVVRWLPGLNNAWINMTDNAFLGAQSAVRGWFSQTAKQKATDFALESLRTLNELMGNAGLFDKSAWTVAKIKELTDAGLKFVMEHPEMTMTSAHTRWAKSLLARPNVNSREIADLAEALKIKFSGQKIGDVDKLVMINQELSRVKMIPNGTGSEFEESAERILQILGTPDATRPTDLEAVVKFLKGRNDADLARVDGLFKGDDITVVDVMNNVKKHLSSVHEANLNSEVTKKLILDSKAAWTLDKVQWAAKILEGIDSQVTVPLARQALWFSTFGIGNAVEAAFRSGLAGFNVVPDMFTRGNDIIKIFEWCCSDLKDFPISELFSFGKYTPVMQSLSKTGDPIGRQAGKYAAAADQFVNMIPGIGKDIGKVKGHGISAKSWRETWDEICARGKASQYFQAYMQKMDELDPAGAVLRRDMRKDLMSAGFTGLSNRELNGLADALAAAHTRGPEGFTALQNMTLTHMRETAMTMRVHELMSKYPSYLTRSTAETVIYEFVHKNGAADPDKVAKRLISNMYGDHALTILKSSDIYREAAEEFSKLDLTQTGNVELVMYMLHGLNESHVDNIHQLNTITKRASIGLPDEKVGEYNWRAFDAHSKYLSDTNTSLRKIVNDLKAKDYMGYTGGLLPNDMVKQKSIRNAIKYYDDRISLYESMHKMEQEILSKNPVNKAGVRDWTKINNEMETIWENVYAQDAKFKASWMVQSKKGPKYELPQFQGDLQIHHVAYLYQKDSSDLIQSLYKGENNTLIGKKQWVADTRGLANKLASLEDKTAIDVGFSDDQIGKVYDTMMKRIGLDPVYAHPMSLNIRDVKDIHYGLRDIANGIRVDQSDLDKWNSIVGKYAKQGSFTNNDVRNEAMIQARKSIDTTFPDYSRENAGDAIMRKLFPYWTYEANRPLWLIKTMVQKPGVMHATGAFFNNTDGGGVHIPGTDYVWNPLANSVWSTLRRNYQKDAPDYFGKMDDPAKKVWDKLGKMGWYHGSWYPLMSMFLGDNDDIASILPPWASNAFNIATAIAPDSEPIRYLQNIVFPSQWRNYLNATWMQDHDIDSSEIIRKVVAQEPLTPEEQDIWARASRYGAVFSFINTEIGNAVKYKPEDLRNAQEAKYTLIEQLYGVPVDVQKYLYMHEGITGEDITMYNPGDPVSDGLIYASQSIVDTAGKKFSLMPREAKERFLIMQEMGTRKDTIRRKYYNSGALNKTSIQQDLMSWCRQGSKSTTGITAAKWVDSLRAIQNAQANEYETVDSDKRYPKYNMETGIGIPRTFEERLDAHKRNGNNFLEDGVTMLLDKYHNIKLELYTDPLTGEEKVPNFDKYFAEQEFILNTLPLDIKPVFMAALEKNMTPMEKVYRAVNKKYLRVYTAAYDMLLATYTDEEQKIIASYPKYQIGERIEAKESNVIVGEDTPAITKQREALAKESNPEVKAMIQTKLDKMIADNTKPLMSDFSSKLQNIHMNMRIEDPEMDAWLMFFGKVTVQAELKPSKTNADLYTPEAKAERKRLGLSEPKEPPQKTYSGQKAYDLYNQILYDIGVGNFEGVLGSIDTGGYK
jgi:hypothetical protein